MDVEYGLWQFIDGKHGTKCHRNDHCQPLGRTMTVVIAAIFGKLSSIVIAPNTRLHRENNICNHNKTNNCHDFKDPDRLIVRIMIFFMDVSNKLQKQLDNNKRETQTKGIQKNN